MADTKPMSLLEALKAFQEQIEADQREPESQDISEDEDPSIEGLIYCYGLDTEDEEDDDGMTVEIGPVIDSIIAQQLVDLDMNFRQLSVGELLSLNHLKKEF